MGAFFAFLFKNRRKEIVENGALRAEDGFVLRRDSVEGGEVGLEEGIGWAVAPPRWR